MGLLKILGIGIDKVKEPAEKPIKETDTSGKKTHEDGGCCGGCGSK